MDRMTKRKRDAIDEYIRRSQLAKYHKMVRVSDIIKFMNTKGIAATSGTHVKEYVEKNFGELEVLN